MVEGQGGLPARICDAFEREARNRLGECFRTCHDRAKTLLDWRNEEKERSGANIGSNWAPREPTKLGSYNRLQHWDGGTKTAGAGE